jgi:hypothetical protein
MFPEEQGVILKQVRGGPGEGRIGNGTGMKIVFYFL